MTSATMLTSVDDDVAALMTTNAVDDAVVDAIRTTPTPRHDEDAGDEPMCPNTTRAMKPTTRQDESTRRRWERLDRSDARRRQTCEARCRRSALPTMTADVARMSGRYVKVTETRTPCVCLYEGVV